MKTIRRSEFAILWETQETVEIAKEYEITVNQVWDLAKGFKLGPKPWAKENRPSPEEIRERAAEVRSRWTEQEMEKRFVGAVAWTPPLAGRAKA